MTTKVAVISIIVENNEAAEPLNRLLHEYASYIIGRMGIPYRERNVSIICVALDAPNDRINALAGSLGRISGITVKTACANI